MDKLALLTEVAQAAYADLPALKERLWEAEQALRDARVEVDYAHDRMLDSHGRPEAEKRWTKRHDQNIAFAAAAQGAVYRIMRLLAAVEAWRAAEDAQ